MSEYTKLFERAAERYEVPELSTAELLRRRDDKRRKQRISAGVVGIAVFVVAIWIVTSVSSLIRTDGSLTPAETGPVETGPTGSTGSAGIGWNGLGFLPPAWTTPSTPAEGEVVASFAKPNRGFVYVFADGRVIWFTDDEQLLNEQRLTPKGVDLVLSDDVQLDRFLDQRNGSLTPTEVIADADAWSDQQIRKYVAPRWAICYVDADGIVDPSSISEDQIPTDADALLSGKERTFDKKVGLGTTQPTTCYELAIDDARALASALRQATIYHDILTRAAFHDHVIGRGDVLFVYQGIEHPEVRPGTDVPLEQSRFGILFKPLLPQGEWIVWD